jgi:hypothetical protein
MAAAPVIPLAILGTGAYLAWFGVHYWRSDTKWPTDPVKNVLRGQSAPKPAGVPESLHATLTADVQALQPDAGASQAGGTVPGTPPPQPSGMGGDPAQNKNLGKLLASTYGWHVEPYWSALVSLWDSESGWDNKIWNTTASCGNNAYAFGIPQACGHGVAKAIPGHGGVCPYPAGNPGNPPECGGSNDAAAQITWGLIYIQQNYGDPTKVPHGGY